MTIDWRNSPVAEDYTIDELMVTALAEYFQNGDQATNGMASFIPVAAFMLARMTHAPELVWIASSVGLEPRPERIPASTLEAPLWRDSIMYLDQYTDFWNFVLNGRWIQKSSFHSTGGGPLRSWLWSAPLIPPRVEDHHQTPHAL